MTSLAQLQVDFQRHLLTGDAAIATHIRASGIGTARRLHIYHHAYRMRLVDTLRDSFGHTLLYLGDEHFNAAALAHVEGHASTHASLRWYGHDFPDTLAARFVEAPQVAELAQLDWALRRAFDGPDAPVLTLADLAALAPERWADVGFSLHPTYARLQLRQNTLAIWQALDQDREPPEAEPLDEPGELLIWRRGHQPHFRSLQPLESAALAGLHAGLGFAAVCAAMSEQFPSEDAAAAVGGLLRRWVDEELLSAVR
ncbi:MULTISPECIES: DNA-binding domain-containing protein [unclassified Roseateles]|uniref:HvfC/BufC N-terminal domain-containing protein n=1 Tax=unclassified Roseateles TaxID=2626991 RepID=UPI0006F85C5D|nr:MULTISPECIES: DNA-binding domain-containing protein [unclassified Roseateles]KQW42461.1 hypothetical protein ASC81_21685 [Pelomonas sp. Root405]KRA68335.1 hypothetical protein ASD88_23270 [Pelomonas sp. Root662]